MMMTWQWRDDDDDDGDGGDDDGDDDDDDDGDHQVHLPPTFPTASLLPPNIPVPYIEVKTESWLCLWKSI